MFHITVGTVVYIDVHSMMLFYLHTAGDGEEMQLVQVLTSYNMCKHKLGSILHAHLIGDSVVTHWGFTIGLQQTIIMKPMFRLFSRFF